MVSWSIGIQQGPSSIYATSNGYTLNMLRTAGAKKLGISGRMSHPRVHPGCYIFAWTLPRTRTWGTSLTIAIMLWRTNGDVTFRGLPLPYHGAPIWFVLNMRAPPPFILFQGQFPGELYKETLVTDVRMAVVTFPPKLRDQGGRPTAGWAPSAPSSRRSLSGGS